MKNNNRHSWLNRFIELVLRKASLVVTTAILLALGSTYWIYQLEISTSRHNLVAADNPYQVRMLNFIKEFGAPEMPIFVVKSRTNANESSSEIQSKVKSKLTRTYNSKSGRIRQGVALTSIGGLDKDKIELVKKGKSKGKGKKTKKRKRKK